MLRHPLIFPRKVDGLSYFSFHVSRAEEAEGVVETVEVIEAFDISKYISPGLISGVIGAVMNAFSFQGVEEAFHGRIIPTIAFPAHGRNDVSGGQVLTIGSAAY